VQARRFVFGSKEGGSAISATMQIAARHQRANVSRRFPALHARMSHVGQIFLASPAVKKADDE